MPVPSEWPMPLPVPARFDPLLAQEASYLAASARMASLRLISMAEPRFNYSEQKAKIRLRKFLLYKSMESLLLIFLDMPGNAAHALT
jgi:hypothetical protein